MRIQKGTRLVDEQGVTYELTECLGKGGQGAVFSVKGGRVAIKLYTGPDAIDPRRRDRLRLQLSQVKRFPLTGLPVTQPLALLQSPYVGYIMEKLTGMTPLQSLLTPPSEAIEWYLATGGLRRRLLLLTTVAETLEQLHTKGLVYGDLSPHNIFISKDVEHAEIRLIDLDNLRAVSTAADHTVYTPFYGAPELIRGKGGATTLSDAHAFAVLAFELLTLVHPLIGDWVLEGEPDQEAAALEGRLPWIDHPTETQNATRRGLPRSVVLSTLMRELAAQTFGPGLVQPLERPGLHFWQERLTAALDATLRCSSCPATYFLNERLCPFCDAPRPAFVRMSFFHWDNQRQHADVLVPPARSSIHSTLDWRRRAAPVLVLEQGRTTAVPARLTVPLSGPQSHRVDVEVRYEGPTLAIRARSSEAQQFVLQSPTGKLEPLRSGWREFPITAGHRGWQLHCGDPSSGSPSSGDPGRSDAQAAPSGHRLATFDQIPVVTSAGNSGKGAS